MTKEASPASKAVPTPQSLTHFLVSEQLSNARTTAHTTRTGSSMSYASPWSAPACPATAFVFVLAAPSFSNFWPRTSLPSCSSPSALPLSCSLTPALWPVPLLHLVLLSHLPLVASPLQR